MDGSTTEGTLEASPSPSPLRNTDLIRTVRSLDQNGPGVKGENLDLLWRCLTASADGKFHAAEESTLRWLLKSMNGPSKDAQTMRRWPMTWKILECVFQRIPLFSLAKSLADRRFMVVLQQTLKDASNPAEEGSKPTTSKRKRSSSRNYALEELSDRESCLMTGDAVFSALKRLLCRLNAMVSGSSNDRIGAEHIRSLFCTSAAEAASMASLSLALCQLALESTSSEDVDGRETWLETISMVWDLHLQGTDDILEVATHLFNPSASILSKLQGFPKPSELVVPEPVRVRWNTDIQTFMYRNLIIPARAAFFNRQDLEALTRALEVSKPTIEAAAPALYFLASGMSEQLLEGRTRKVNADWMKQVFKAVETAVRDRDDRDTLMKSILGRAAERSMPVDNDDLRTVCRKYALKEDETNWRLIADIATCEPDVFQLSEEGVALLKEVCDRSTAKSLSEEDHEAVSKVLGAVVQGFRTSRDFAGLLKLWYGQLCKVEKQKTAASSPWLKLGASKENETLQTLIEKELSPQQLLDVLGWIETQKSHSKALCLFLSTIAQGINGETYIDAVGRKLFDLVASVNKSSSPLTSLKWAVVAKTLSWVSPSERSEIWSEVKKPLSRILSEASLQSRETFEAFKCCCQTWTSMSPDDEHVDEPATLVESFTVRLATELITTKAFKNTSVSPYLQPKSDLEFSEEDALQHYLVWFLRGSSRLSKMQSAKMGSLPQTLQNAVSSSKIELGDLQGIWKCILRNENNINDAKLASDLIERLSKSIDEQGKEKKWPGENCQLAMQSLNAIPTDAFTRPQREQIMTILKAHRSKATKRISEEGWRLILSLSTKLMGRPTFYDGLHFVDNAEIADTMSDFSSGTSLADGSLGDLIELYYGLASTTIRQMAEHIEERSVKYFEESRDFITECDSANGLSPFRLTLLKALVVETANGTNLQSHSDLVKLPQIARDVLGKCVSSATDYFITDKKAFEKHDVLADLRLLAAVDATEVLGDLAEILKPKKSDVRKAEKRGYEAMLSGDIRGWKLQKYLRTYFPSLLEEPRPTSFGSLSNLPAKLREPLLRGNVEAVMRGMDTASKLQYLKDLVGAFRNGSDADGQVMAIQLVVNQLIDQTGVNDKTEGFDLATAHSELAPALVSTKSASNAVRVCRILQVLLERKSQAMTQWNVEVTLSTVCHLASPDASTHAIVPYVWLCKLVEVIIKKHRLRLEGHHHLLLTAMQTLLRNLITTQAPSDPKDMSSQESKAHLYTRLVTLICEPTAGAVSRSQHQSALDSATDAAKRSVGRHMYLMLMQYVKLQLEVDIPRVVREALEPAVNSVFDITPPEVRKILNDAMDGSGRALLREMYRRYTRFGKWSGV